MVKRWCIWQKYRCVENIKVFCSLLQRAHCSAIAHNVRFSNTHRIISSFPHNTFVCSFVGMGEGSELGQRPKSIVRPPFLKRKSGHAYDFQTVNIFQFSIVCTIHCHHTVRLKGNDYIFIRKNDDSPHEHRHFLEFPKESKRKMINNRNSVNTMAIVYYYKLQYEYLQQ